MPLWVDILGIKSSKLISYSAQNIFIALSQRTGNILDISDICRLVKNWGEVNEATKNRLLACLGNNNFITEYNLLVSKEREKSGTFINIESFKNHKNPERIKYKGEEITRKTDNTNRQIPEGTTHKSKLEFPMGSVKY